MATKTQACCSCGKEVYGIWNDDKTGKEWPHCKACGPKVWKTLPFRVKDRFTQHPRPKVDISFLVPHAEIEVTKVYGGKPTIRGKAAQECWDKLGTFAPYVADVQKLKDLYAAKPREKFLVYSKQGRFLDTAKTYPQAEALAGKESVIVFWGGN